MDSATALRDLPTSNVLSKFPQFEWINVDGSRRTSLPRSSAARAHVMRKVCKEKDDRRRAAEAAKLIDQGIEAINPLTVDRTAQACDRLSVRHSQEYPYEESSSTVQSQTRRSNEPHAEGFHPATGISQSVDTPPSLERPLMVMPGSDNVGHIWYCRLSLQKFSMNAASHPQSAHISPLANIQHKSSRFLQGPYFQ